MIRHGDLEFDPASRTVTVDGEAVSLSARALAILEALLERPGMPLSRERLEQILYGWGEGVESNTVEVHILQSLLLHEVEEELKMSARAQALVDELGGDGLQALPRLAEILREYLSHGAN